MLKYIYLVLSFCVVFVCKSQPITIEGNAKSYAGDMLYLHSYSDLISKKVNTIAECKVAKNGDFKFVFTSKHVLYTFIDLDVFKIFLYVEPNKKYTIVLPKKTKKLPEDKLNPFFEATEYSAKLLNTNDAELNTRIRKFDKLYDFYLQKYLGTSRRLSLTMVDSIVKSVEKDMPKSGNNPFFEDYKTYSYAYLKFMAYGQNKEKLMRQYFAGKPILYNNTSYIRLFNSLFDNYLSYFAKTKKGKKVPQYLIRYRSLRAVKSIMDSVDYLANDTLQELIICKSLFDNFYAEDFPGKSIIAVIDSVKHFGVNAQNRLAASNIYDEITNLLVGYDAPDFSLRNQYRQKYSLHRLRGNFVYLNFINIRSYACLKQLEILKTLHAKKYEKLKIVSICVCENAKEMKQFVKENKYKWTFLYYSDNKVLNDYKVKVYPTYYMINPDGKLVMSPAFEPTAYGFEKRYLNILKEWKKNINRRQVSSH